MTAKTITIKGKKYDAATGEPVNSLKARSSQHLPAHAVHRKQQRATTLMRRAVRPPAASAQTTSKKKPGQNHTAGHTTVTPVVQPSLLASLRLDRARSIRRSALVSRFGSIEGMPKLVRRHEPIPVKPAPPHSDRNSDTPSSFATEPNASTVDPFLKAIKQANSHHEKATHPHKRRRLAHHIGRRARVHTVGAAMITVVVFGAFFYWQGAPNREFRAAAASAGIQAVLPHYTPAGFRQIDGPETGAGRVVLHFGTKTDNRHYSITQSASQWTSQTLLDKYVLASRQPYQVIETDDKIIYTIDGSTATWVSRGTWVQITSDAGLSTDQLLAIASSM